LFELFTIETHQGVVDYVLAFLLCFFITLSELYLGWLLWFIGLVGRHGLCLKSSAFNYVL